MNDNVSFIFSYWRFILPLTGFYLPGGIVVHRSDFAPSNRLKLAIA